MKIPPELRAYENDIQRFVYAMTYKLAKNAHKGRWEQLDLQDTLAKLSLEFKELEEAIEHGNAVEIMLEAADVANFAMIACSITLDGK